MYQKKSNFNKKKSLFSQCIINEDISSFIVAKKFNNFTSIVSPFVYDPDDNIYNSYFYVPHIRAHRIQSLYNLMPKIAQYSAHQDYIYFDCLERLPPDSFNNYNSGYIHFYMQNESSNVVDENGHKNEIIDVDIRLTMKELEDQTPIKIENHMKINFSTNFIKVFPVILSKGFIVAIATAESCTLYLSLSNPSKGYVGKCIRKEVANITQNIFPIWPIFNVIADENINKIFIKKDIIEKIDASNYNKLMLKFQYTFDDSSQIYATKVCGL